jgi:hypothetical protein
VAATLDRPPAADRRADVTTLPAVLLDANAYRALSDARFDPLFEAERSRGVARYCDPFVVSEFLAHLADPADPDFPGGECGILRDSESRLAEFITGKGLKAHDDYTEKVVAPLFADIALTPADQPLTRMEPHLRGIAEHMAGIKSAFADTGRRLQETIDTILAGEGPEERKATLQRARRTHESAATRRTFAEAFIRQAYASAGIAPPDPLPDALVARVLQGAAAAIEFEALIWETIAFQRAKPDSPHIRSLRWDQRIAFNIGWAMRGQSLWLITDDGAFARVAKAVGHEDRVHTLEAYEQWLGVAPTE